MHDVPLQGDFFFHFKRVALNLKLCTLGKESPLFYKPIRLRVELRVATVYHHGKREQALQERNHRDHSEEGRVTILDKEEQTHFQQGFQQRRGDKSQKLQSLRPEELLSGELVRARKEPDAKHMATCCCRTRWKSSHSLMQEQAGFRDDSRQGF